MIRPHAFRVSTFLITGAALAFALPAAAHKSSPAPIVYKGSGQGGVPQADRSATQDQWRGPVTRTGAASLPDERQRLSFSYPGSPESPKVEPLRQVASVDSEPLASIPETTSDRLWPVEMQPATASPTDQFESKPRTLTLGAGEQPMPEIRPMAATLSQLTPKATAAIHEEQGLASWYGEAFHGNPTANGEIFDMNAMTAAHRTLPLPSLVQVVNESNGKEIVVRVNDRGPFTDGRIIDLSKRAAETLGVGDMGTMPVTVRYLGPAPAVPELQMASAEKSAGEELQLAEATPAAPARPDLYGDMLLGGVEPTLGVPDPGKSVATPARLVPETELAGSNVPAAPRLVVAENLAPAEPAPSPAQAYQPASHPQPVQAAYTPKRSSPATAFAPRIYVQVGAFADISNAQGMDVQVGSGFNTDVESVRLNGADYFRVLVGPFPTRDAAEQAKVQLRMRGVTDGFVVVR